MPSYQEQDVRIKTLEIQAEALQAHLVDVLKKLQGVASALDFTMTAISIGTPSPIVGGPPKVITLRDSYMDKLTKALAEAAQGTNEAQP